MPAPDDISFELERFEWASPDRLEVQGQWHGVRRRLPRATLVIEVDGERRRLRALPDPSPASPERWIAAFPWEGEMQKLPGAELEVGRGIVVELPRPRRSKVRGAAAPAAAIPGREEAERLLAVLTAARTEADEAAARAAAAEADATEARERAEKAEAEVAPLRARAEAAHAERESLRTRTEEAEAEVGALRARAEAADAELASLRGGSEEVDAERESLRTRAEEAEAEADTLRALAESAEGALDSLRSRSEPEQAEREALRARAEEAEAELAALRAESAAPPALERLREELATVERERMELRAQLDATMERLEAAGTTERTEAMPGPRTAAAAGADARRPTRRPAERTAQHFGDTPEPVAGSLGERVSDWVTSFAGSKSEPQNGRAAEAKPGPPTAARSGRARPPRTDAAATARRRSDRRAASKQEHPSWVLRVAAIGLLAGLMIALLVIVISLL